MNQDGLDDLPSLPQPPPSQVPPAALHDHARPLLPTTSFNESITGFGHDSRQGRPPNPHRQSSYSKRHASFDTPREVPFPAEPPSDTSTRRVSLSRSSSGSTVNANLQGLNGHDTQPYPQEHATEPDGKQKDTYETGLIMVDSSSTTQPMTYKSGEDGRGFSHSRTTSAPLTHEKLSESVWDSQHLRPHLLSSARKGKIRDFSTASPYPSHPRFVDAVQSPAPTRPSSTLSLPLPSQTPYSTLPSSYDQASCGLPSVVEQVVSNFDSGADPLSNYDAPMETQASSQSDFSPMFDPHTLQRRASSPSATSNNLFALFDAADRLGRRFGRESTAASISTVSTSLSSSSNTSSSSSSLPPPTPPTVLPPSSSADLSGDGRSMPEEEKRRSAPYEPFLSHAPPPADTHITVETLDNEYRLIVRLPGYDRECIMLSTRRRRILHVAADSWKAGGGHFERRISFGYDADLNHVRAEFDGENLRVLVPRKIVPVAWSGGCK